MDLKEGYEVIEDPTSANDAKKAARRRALMVANAREIEVAGYNAQGSEADRHSAVPCYDE